jgi:putative DNA primase/helicase
MVDNGKMFEPLPGAGTDAVDARPGESRGRAAKTAAWEPIVPVPNNAPAPPDVHPMKGKASATWAYRGSDGRPWFRVCRFDMADGQKEVLPQTFCRHPGRERPEWRWKALPAPRPLYHLDDLAARSDAPVVVVEGEKPADAAATLLPDHVCVTSPGGSNGARRSDWGILAGRTVIVWPDADEPGWKYAGEVARILGNVGAASVAIAQPPEGVAPGWDAADALAEAWDTERALMLIDTARPAAEVMQESHGSAGGTEADGSRGRNSGNEGDGSEAEGGRRRGPPQRDNLVALIDGAELWHDPAGEAHVTFGVNSHRENWPVRSRVFKNWLAHGFYQAHDSAPGSQAIQDAMSVIEAVAVHDGPEHKTFLRVGGDDRSVYVDLGGPDWRAVAITADGWEMVEQVPVKLIRSGNMRPLPVPESGEPIDRLRSLINYNSESDFRLIVSHLVASFRPQGPYPILLIGGEQGSAKSTLTRLLRSLVDPNVAPIRSAPRDERELIVAAKNGWTLAFDNLSRVPEWMSNALCRLSTGGGFSARELFSDWGEAVFAGQRPIIINGIGSLASLPDLADRSLTVTLRAIPDDERRPEREWEKGFHDDAPFILGAVFDGVSAALRHLSETRLDQLPRMADFATWIVAAEPGLGWEPGSFLPIYAGNRQEAIEISIEADPVAQAVLALVADVGPWEGSAAELVTELEARATESTRKSRYWPNGPGPLSKRLSRAAPLLRAKGVLIERFKAGKNSDRRMLIKSVNG